jgi:flagellin
LRINHNIAALNAYANLSRNQNSTSKIMEKLSSGLRINRAADDAAGLAISEKMRGQISGLTQANRNSLDGISLIQTAEGALGEVQAMLQRMRELTVQAANGTNTDSDRSAIQDEINQLTSEINRVGNATEFNAQKLINGEKVGAVTSTGNLVGGKNQVPAQAASNTFTLTAGNTLKIDAGTASGAKGNVPVTIQAGAGVSPTAAWNGNTLVISLGTNPANNTAATIQTAVQGIGAGVPSGLTMTNFTVTGTGTLNAGGFDQTTLGATQNGVLFGGADQINAVNASDSLLVSSIPAVGDTLTINNKTIGFYDGSLGPAPTGFDAVIDIAGLDPSDPNAKTTLANKIAQYGSNGNSPIPGIGVNITAFGEELIVTSTAGGLAGNNITTGYQTSKPVNVTLQIGANQGQSFTFGVGDMRSQSLGISASDPNMPIKDNQGNIIPNAAYVTVKNVTDGISDNNIEYALDVSTSEKAGAAITVIDNAITKVSAERSKLGAFQNRLEHTLNNLNTTTENLTSAESRIRDADMAQEMTEFTKMNVINQAATAMLAQANQLPQGVLQLLKG